MKHPTPPEDGRRDGLATGGRHDHRGGRGGGDHQGWVRTRRDLRGGAPSTGDGDADEADETRAARVTEATVAVRAAGSKVPV